MSSNNKFYPLFLKESFNFFFVILISMTLFSYQLCANSESQGINSDIFVQATLGSFNHQALELLLPEKRDTNSIHFCGTPYNAMQSAFQRNGLAFVALKNSTIQGNFVEATLEALQHFQITRAIAFVRMKIEMSLIRHQEALQWDIPLSQIASHPAALQQINHWKKRQDSLLEIAVPEGTSEAARKLSMGEFELNTGVIGPKNLAFLYPHLAVVETGIQDKEDNYTIFAILEVSQREEPAHEMEIKRELNDVLWPAESQFQEDPSFFQIYWNKTPL